MIIGLDVGSTITKVVSFNQGRIISKSKSKAFDPITSATGALGKLLIENKYKISDIQKIYVTGVGSSQIKDNIFDIPTSSVNEIDAIGIGGKNLSNMDDILITNIGTGTAIVSVLGEKINHIGGTGIGGGTILGLAKALINISDFSIINNLAKNGKIGNIDLQIKDILDTQISFLNKDATVSNFGKITETANNNDIALGIINMVFQVIGMLSVFSAKSCNLNTVVFTGNGSKNEIGKLIMLQISEMYKLNFLFPENGEYSTAIGAALSAL